ncbi:MAG TPA: DUF11 domain-containing protein [Ilumatobacter sp.]|nr:DUF11 domain-containing protein [Ilumatobacter sp.]
MSGPASSNNDGAASPGLPVDLALAKDGPTTYATGDTISYTLTLTNNGPGNSSGSTLTDTLPTNLTGVSSPTAGCSIDAGQMTCVVGPLAAGASTIITAEGTAGAAGGELTNTASVLGNEADPNPANNEASTSAQPAAPSLTLVKSSDTAEITEVGQIVEYAFLVTNTGNMVVSEVAVGETEFSGAGTAPVAECPDTELAPSESVTCTAEYTVVAADLSGDDLTNTAVATGVDPAGGSVASEPSTVEIPTVPMSTTTTTTTTTTIPTIPTTTAVPAPSTLPTLPTTPTVPPTPQLPDTGRSPAGGAAASILVLAGAAFVLISRRNRPVASR